MAPAAVTLVNSSPDLCNLTVSSPPPIDWVPGKAQRGEGEGGGCKEGRETPKEGSFRQGYAALACVLVVNYYHVYVRPGG